MYYSRPISGRAVRPFTTTTVEVTDITQWRFKKVARWNRRSYAIFVNGSNEEIMQSLQAIRFVRLRPGEDNYNAKLSNAEGLEIFRRANEGESTEVLSKEFNVSKRYVGDIKNVRTRVGITLNYLNGLKKTEPAKANVAARNKNKKLSPELAKFIRSDNKIQNMNVKQLASKYCVSERTIQRILKGSMYQETK